MTISEQLTIEQMWKELRAAAPNENREEFHAGYLAALEKLSEIIDREVAK